MAGVVKHVENDGQFQSELNLSENKLVVVDFFATWCGPCQRIAPIFEQYAAKYGSAIFLKVDVEKCLTTAQSYQISAMPTFVFLKGRSRVDMLRGADPAALEEKIKKWYGDPEETGDSVVKGHIDLSAMIIKSGCECLNQSDDHPLEHALVHKGGYLESDCDEQLIIAVAFNQKVKLHSLVIRAPADKGPKVVKIFVNQPSTVDFDKADGMAPTQLLQLTPEDLQEGSVINLKFVKFQFVENINLFIQSNQGDTETTQIDYLGFIGSPQQSTDMSDFKRIAGKKGESH